MNNSYCLLIPVYNHATLLKKHIQNIVDLGYHILIVDDGSNNEHKLCLEQIAAQYPTIHLLRSEENKGKGSAIKIGIHYCYEQGIDYAFQLDADGQHDLASIQTFIETSEKNPYAFIVGYPQYDESVPLIRKYAREITNFWVKIETLSTNILDALCGFRIYPVASTEKILCNKSIISNRMEIDLELLVRHSWANTLILFLPVQVTYPESGTSHFKMVRDNLLISLKHSQLVCGMILRFPCLLCRKFKKKQNSLHWTEQKDAPTHSFLLKTTLLLYKLLGLKGISLLLYPIIFVYFLISSQQRAASKEFLEKASISYTLLNAYTHFYSFGLALIEKIAAWNNDISDKDLHVVNKEVYQDIEKNLQEKKGIVFLCSHLGNTEMLRAMFVSSKNKNFAQIPVNIFMNIEKTATFNQLLETLSTKFNTHIIDVNSIRIETISSVMDKLEQGEIVVIAGDRTPKHNSTKCIPLSFLGEKALFPYGAFLLPILLKHPTYIFFALRSNAKEKHKKTMYNLFLSQVNLYSNVEKKESVELLAKDFVCELEKKAIEYPYQWYNFYSFWRKNEK